LKKDNTLFKLNSELYKYEQSRTSYSGFFFVSTSETHVFEFGIAFDLILSNEQAMSKTASAIIIILISILCFPIAIGIVGGVFGAVFGVIGGLFGAVFGILGGLIGAIFGFIGWVFEGMFGWGWDSPFHADWNFFTIAAIVIVIAVIAKKSQRTNS
jgi:hypothetical protein